MHTNMLELRPQINICDHKRTTNYFLCIFMGRSSKFACDWITGSLFHFSEKDLVSAVAQQDCRPQISIQFSPPKAFDFMMDPSCSQPHAKWGSLPGPPVKGLLKEYGSKASICITKKKEKEKVYFPSAPFTKTAVLPWGVTDETKASL